jgi:hypothetical protein
MLERIKFNFKFGKNATVDLSLNLHESDCAAICFLSAVFTKRKTCLILPKENFLNFSKMDDTIRVGQYIIVQRQNFTKLHKFSALDSTVSLGKELVELKNIAGQNFFQTFKMKLKTSGKKRLYELEVCDNATNVKDILVTIESGSDNRNILDDGKVKMDA